MAKTYTWSAEAKIEISGQQFETLNLMVNELVSDSSTQYAKHVALYEGSKVMAVIFQRLLENGTIKEGEEITPTNPVSVPKGKRKPKTL